ncbi:MAG TPA: hypothetical protein VKE30_03255 [Chthoniobacterales bacterium]|nr:hypothetical protein [Chthoniobacterales bacterium]
MQHAGFYPISLANFFTLLHFTSESRQRVSVRTPRLLVPLLGSAYLAFLAVNHSTQAQVAASQSIEVTAEALPSAYGAPTSFSQSRFSPTTNAYVLPPGAIYASLIYEDDVVHFRPPDHHFTEEVEIGLPYRFNVAFENDVQHFDGDTQDATFSVEARYAFADWDNIPLNPTIFAEYKFGIGNILHDEGAPTPAHKFGPGGFDKGEDIPDAYELRLLLSEDFFDRVEWSLNTFFEQETAGDRGREWGIAQSIVTPIHLFHEGETSPAADYRTGPGKAVQPVAGTSALVEELKAGIECQFRSFSDKESRGTPYNSFVIGPTITWRTTHNLRLDISPLFGVNHKSPVMELFVVASYYFGGGHGAEAGGEAPASTRNR